ncbi:glycosyltransferase family 61 protein [Methylobacterium sp. E-005]|uniref:glycosyltransferase family 61 protein n=1 Tax=Methylobacterium sp. E-005 TaxID=2836549 RepID=UPI001FBB9E1A|nr:glycosyltransferase family 61 protein [Methylobacterium sp. E-005]MCJ2087298.1 glycosyltransferase family 61 protein [Methylobacterium sp. E-005]
MRPAETFIDLIRTINRDNAADVLKRLRAQAAIADHADPDIARVRRHLETLAFRLEGEERLGAVADTYDLIGSIAPEERARWALAAVSARLRDLCESGRYTEATAAVSELRAGGDPAAIREGLSTLLRLGWIAECGQEPEICVQCYRLAYELNGGDDGVTTEDGFALSTKVRNLRRLQIDALLAEGRYADAIALHEPTRHVYGSGPLRAYDIVTAATLAAGGGATYTEMRPRRRIAPPDLRFFERPPALTSEPGELDMPPHYLAFLDGAHAFPRSNVVIAGDTLVYDLAAHPRRPDILLQDGVNPDQIMMAAFAGTRALVEVPEDPHRIEAGLMMFGLQSRNYGHWFCEYVPRMLCYNDPRCPDGIPLCIDDHMPPSHEEILRLLDTRDRPVIKLPPRPVAFGRLGMAPPPAFFPFEMKPGRPVYDAIWPADIFAAVRERILASARARGVLSDRTDRRLFISRKAFSQRALVNEAEIAERLTPLGFEVIYPETMSFLEQVEAFHSAALVMGSSSSALSNALFCRPECRILGLIHEELAFNFRGYASYIEVGGARILFLRGQTLHRPGVHAFHVSYSVDPAKVVAAVAALENEVATGVRAGFPPPSADDRPIRVPDRDTKPPRHPPADAPARVDPDRLARVRTLAAGPHADPGAGLCALEAVAYVAGEPHSDSPACASPSLATFLRTWGDRLPQDERDALILPLVPRLVGTRGSEALERRRVAMIADWLVRTHLPAWFRLAKLNVEGDALADRPALTDSADLAAWCDPLEQARKRAKVANLTLRQTGAAVRTAAWDAAHQAAWAAIRGDLEAAGPRILAAGWDAAYASAYAATRAYGKAPLEPTRQALQESVLALVERMIAVRETDPSEPDRPPADAPSVHETARSGAEHHP